MGTHRKHLPEYQPPSVRRHRPAPATSPRALPAGGTHRSKPSPRALPAGGTHRSKPGFRLPSVAVPIGLLALLLLVVGLVANALTGGQASGDDASTVTSAAARQKAPPGAGPGAAAGTVSLGTDLTSSRESDIQEDPAVSVRGKAELKLRGNQLCFTLSWQGLGSVTSAKIHAGTVGVTGRLKAALFSGQLPSGLRGAAGCVNLQDQEFASALVARPATYYLMLSSKDAPGGAVRGQLLNLVEPVDVFRDLRGPLVALTDGAQELSPLGDRDGRATGYLKISPERSSFVMTWAKIKPPTFAHVHKGRIGQPEDTVIFPLFSAPKGLPQSLTGVAGVVNDTLTPAAIRSFSARPTDFYIRVHNTDHPAGALRGQLLTRGPGFKG